jgi:hypothetical protein
MPAKKVELNRITRKVIITTAMQIPHRKYLEDVLDVLEVLHLSHQRLMGLEPLIPDLRYRRYLVVV